MVAASCVELRCFKTTASTITDRLPTCATSEVGGVHYVLRHG